MEDNTIHPTHTTHSNTLDALDCISRQAAINTAIVAADEWDGGYSRSRDEIITMKLRMLPSAQSEVAKDTNVPSNDCISRQSAIDAMANAIWHYPNELYRGLNQYETARELAKIGLSSLPSAQPDVPDKNVGKIGDLIDREAVIDAIAKMMPTLMSTDGSHPADADILKAQDIFVDCMETIEILPSAQPEHLCVVMDKISKAYEKAINTPCIHNPMAWALYQVWKEYDR